MRRAGEGSPNRRGTSLVEVLVALLLTTLLIQASWSLLVSARRAAGRLIEWSEALETERLAWHVLSREAGAGVPARDWTLAAPRVLALRAFRGLAEICGPLAEPGGGVVRYGGLRQADPAKDSLLVLARSGAWHAVKLVDRVADGPACPGWPPAPVERWIWDPPVEGALLARVFERGSYHLEDRAVRYRIGDGGRQPLTPERLQQAGSGFAATSAGLEMRLRVTADRDRDVVWESARRIAGTEDGGP